MTKRELEEKVRKLEKEIEELKNRPIIKEIHHHYYYGYYPYVTPQYPYITYSPFFNDGTFSISKETTFTSNSNDIFIDLDDPFSEGDFNGLNK